MATKELLEGCAECGSKFFFYIREEQLEAAKEKLIEIPDNEKAKIEKEVRDIAGITEEGAPVILDFESVRVTGSGKFEIDLAKIFNPKRPLVYKLEEGKYIIDLSSLSSEKKEE